MWSSTGSEDGSLVERRESGKLVHRMKTSCAAIEVNMYTRSENAKPYQRNLPSSETDQEEWKLRVEEWMLLSIVATWRATKILTSQGLACFRARHKSVHTLPEQRLNFSEYTRSSQPVGSRH